MNDRNSAPPLGFQAKRRPMAEAVAFADMIVRRYGRGAGMAGSEAERAGHSARSEAPRESTPAARPSSG